MIEAPHRKLEAWKSAIELVLITYKFTRTFPKEENFILVAQMRRAAISIPSNIAEGASDRSRKEFSHFLSIALGSLSELDTQLEIAKNLNYIQQEEAAAWHRAIAFTKALTYGLRKSIKTRNS